MTQISAGLSMAAMIRAAKTIFSLRWMLAAEFGVVELCDCHRSCGNVVESLTRSLRYLSR